MNEQMCDALECLHLDKWFNEVWDGARFETRVSFSLFIFLVVGEGFKALIDEAKPLE